MVAPKLKHLIVYLDKYALSQLLQVPAVSLAMTSTVSCSNTRVAILIVAHTQMVCVLYSAQATDSGPAFFTHNS